MIRLLYGQKNLERNKRQAMLLSQPEIAYLTRAAQEAADTGTAKDAEAHIDARFGKGREGRPRRAARDGRARRRAGERPVRPHGDERPGGEHRSRHPSRHLAHAFTVHAEESESDYFTVVDDLTQDAGETGTAGLFETELTSGLFYGYVVVDVPGLVGNLGGDRALAGGVVEHLVHLAATVSPGAKRGPTAPYAYADLVLVELGSRQSRSLAGAFRNPVPLGGNVLGTALGRLAGHMGRLDAAYGQHGSRAALLTTDAALPGVPTPRPLDDLAAWAAAAVRAEAQGAA